MDGQPVDVSGVLLRFDDDLEMIQVSNRNGMVAAEDPAPVLDWGGPDREALGPVSLKGELLDSKCFRRHASGTG